MIKKLFERAACATLQKGIDWITPDLSACILLSDFEQALQLNFLTPLEMNAHQRKECQNLLELSLIFNPLDRKAQTDVFPFGGEANTDKPCVIRSQYSSFRTGSTKIAVMIYDPARAHDEYRRHHIQPLFAISGTMVGAEKLAITKIILPRFHRMAFDGSAPVKDRAAIVNAALDFGGRCIHHIGAGSPLFLYSDYIDAGLKLQDKGSPLAIGGMRP